MQEKKDSKYVVLGDEAKKNLIEGARQLFETVSVTYGPKGRNMLVEKSYGKFMLTRDGVTVARETYTNDGGVNIGTQALNEAAEITNRMAGDGTSATVILGYHLMRYGVQAIAAGIHEMDVRDMLFADRDILLKELGAIGKKPVKKQLQQVATVSSGDTALGQLIAEALAHVGPDGGIITEKAYTSEVEREYVDGYYLQSGFTALQEGKKELSDTPVVVVSRTIRGGTEVVDILQKVSEVTGHAPGQPMRILLVGNLEDDAYNTVIENIKRHTIDAIIIKTPPMFGDMGKELLEDIAAYCNCEPISETTTLDIVDKKYVGKIHRVKVSKTESTLFADKLTDLADLRIAYIKSQIAAKDVVAAAILEKLKDRLAKLQGKIALFKIGGATDTSKEEKEFRVEDAINATRAAYTDGVVPGGGATLLKLAGLKTLSTITRDALEDTFKQLLLNAGLEAEVKLDAARGSGKGYDLKNGHGELTDMVESGVLDPKLVVEQVIVNATQAAADILTAGGEIIIKRKED